MDKVFSGFWQTLARPIIGMAPMDGVTDFACRAITAKHGRPSVMMTEFTTATGLFYAPERILRDFEYSEIERPVVAQIYGNIPEDFYRAAHVVCELGFDGIDINMGCPSKAVTQKLCGGRLITAPDLALEIVRATRNGIHDWASGQTLTDIKTSAKVIRVIERMNEGRQFVRKKIPYSVKTRIGYDDVVIEKWVETLLSEKPAVITVHGRTLKQMYKGLASWEAIAAAVRVAKGSGTLILGNGDIHSLEEAHQKIEMSGVDGVLIGRGSMGNPWIFKGHQPTQEERLQVALEHAALYDKGKRDFKSIRKHLIGYLSHFKDAAALRHQAIQTHSYEDLKNVLDLTKALPISDSFHAVSSTAHQS